MHIKESTKYSYLGKKKFKFRNDIKNNKARFLIKIYVISKKKNVRIPKQINIYCSQ